MTDLIADFLTRIRNAVKANHKVVEAPGSKIKQEMTKILYEQGYICLLYTSYGREHRELHGQTQEPLHQGGPLGGSRQ